LDFIEPDRTGSDRIGSGRIGSDRVGSGRIGLKKGEEVQEPDQEEGEEKRDENEDEMDDVARCFSLSHHSRLIDIHLKSHAIAGLLAVPSIAITAFFLSPAPALDVKQSTLVRTARIREKKRSTLSCVWPTMRLHSCMPIMGVWPPRVSTMLAAGVMAAAVGSPSAKNAVSACRLVQPGVVMVQQMSAAAVGRSLAAINAAAAWMVEHAYWRMYGGHSV
jgi:hypothetical protein